MPSTSKQRQDKRYKRDLLKWDMHSDHMPRKSWRRWKKAERQRGKKESAAKED